MDARDLQDRLWEKRGDLGGFVQCTPEQARDIRAEFGIVFDHEKNPPKVFDGPPRRPTLVDYNALLEEMGRSPISEEDYRRMKGQGDDQASAG